jgi:hypothetical protein
VGCRVRGIPCRRHHRSVAGAGTRRRPRHSRRPLQPDTSKAFTAAELDQLMAPIALYPDALLAQILMAATYPWR